MPTKLLDFVHTIKAFYKKESVYKCVPKNIIPFWSNSKRHVAQCLLPSVAYCRRVIMWYKIQLNNTNFCTRRMRFVVHTWELLIWKKRERKTLQYYRREQFIDNEEIQYNLYNKFVADDDALLRNSTRMCKKDFQYLLLEKSQ